MIRYIIIAVCLTVLPMSAAVAEPDIPSDNRIKILTYSANDIYTIPTRYGYQTSLVFARNEEVETVSVGDRSLWQIIPSGNRIFIRPMVDDVATNMTIITNMREYHFDIKSTSDTKAAIVYVAQFRYPDAKSHQHDTLDDAEITDREAPAPAMPVKLHSSSGTVAIPPLDTQRTGEINLRYSYTGPDHLAPAKVYDDGRNTYVQYDAMPSPLPQPYIRSASKEMVLANYRINGNQLVINNVTSGFQLRGTDGTLTVYNDSLSDAP